MPRPSKRVSPDTLGGRIRAARQELHLSLAEVAGERYSTSLISQIERNRVDPSQESLRYLAERLELPLEDLAALAQQQRNSEVEVSRYKIYEEQRIQAQQALANNRPREALKLLEDLPIAQIPLPARWRLVALRGQCYFNLRQFVSAQRDFLAAVAEKPEIVPSDQNPEVMLLYLYLAAASRELGQLDDALKQYQVALKMMNVGTSLRYIAEAEWGMAFTAFELAKRAADESGSPHVAGSLVQTALHHAESARTMYQAIGDELNVAALSCEIGLIEQASGRLDEARTMLRRVLEQWQPILAEPVENTSAGQRRKQERANVISAAACYLAGVELEAGNHEAALAYVRQAEDAGKQSYILRRAEAAMMLGRILETMSINHPECDGSEAERAFRKAIEELEPTDRLAAKILAHDLLGRHLLKKGKTREGEIELNRARGLSHFVPTLGSALTPESSNGGNAA
ncbi:MAG TPA: helix-turn-helix domain-containing protein [Ktedonobacteraceae bacterium]|nr:helix-turn-helix domain-containing protein [Ktedonobacteraceae bacterium]